MADNDISVDELVDELKALLDEPEVPATSEESPKEAPQAKQDAPVVKAVKKPKAQKANLQWLSTLGRGFAKVMIALVTTVLLLAMALYGVMYVLAKGPSPTARDLFVRSVRETSAIGFLANLYFSEAEIQAIVQGNDTAEYIETDTSLIQIPQPDNDEDESDAPVADQ